METQREQAQRGRLTGVKATPHQHQLRAKFNVNVQKRVENVLFHVGGWGDIYCKGGRQGETDTTGQRGTREKKTTLLQSPFPLACLETRGGPPAPGLHLPGLEHLKALLWKSLMAWLFIPSNYLY